MSKRKEAIERGDRYYFTGKPCKSGHISNRHVIGGTCNECVRLAGVKWFKENSKDAEWRKRRLFLSLKQRAIKKKIPFEIEYEDIVWNSVCPVFGVELEYTANATDGLASSNSASFDKINPKLGYIKGNVCIISFRANWLKQDSTLEELKQIVTYLENVK